MVALRVSCAAFSSMKSASTNLASTRCSPVSAKLWENRNSPPASVYAGAVGCPSYGDLNFLVGHAASDFLR